MIAPTKALPDIKAFTHAMKGIYDEAKKIGYNPTEFFRMLEREGALSTAKRLIMIRKASSDFTKLRELGRLDLSVESLALQDKWRRLFSEEELQHSRQRLDQYRKP